MATRKVTSKPAAEHNGGSGGTGCGIRAELTETPRGWVLTLHTSAAMATVLRAAGIGRPTPDRLSITISPNLVPGEAFDIDTVHIAVDTDAGSAGSVDDSAVGTSPASGSGA